MYYCLLARHVLLVPSSSSVGLVVQQQTERVRVRGTGFTVYNLDKKPTEREKNSMHI